MAFASMVVFPANDHVVVSKETGDIFFYLLKVGIIQFTGIALQFYIEQQLL